jgi:hypothetical protein
MHENSERGQENQLEQPATTRKEAVETSKLPEKIPSAIFSRWVEFLQSAFKDPAIMQLFREKNHDAIFAWAQQKCRELAQNYDTKKRVQTIGTGPVPETLEKPATHFFEDSEYGRDSVWKMLRNGINAVLIQVVVPAFENDFVSALEAHAATQNSEFLLTVPLPNGRSVQVIDQRSQLGEQLKAPRPINPTPEFFGLENTSYPTAAAWQELVLTHIADLAAQLPQQLKFSSTFSYRVNGEDIGGTVPLEVAKLGKADKLVVATHTSPTKKYYDLASITDYEVAEGKKILIELRTKFLSRSLTDTTWSLLAQLFEEHIRDWDAQQTSAQTDYADLVSYQAEIIMKARTPIELAEFPAMEELSAEDTRAITLQTVVNGFSTGVAEFSKVVNLEIAYKQLETIVKKYGVSILAIQTVNSVNLQFPELRTFLYSKYDEKAILKAVELFITCVINGEFGTVRTNKILSQQYIPESDPEGPPLPPIEFSKFLDTNLYSALLARGPDSDGVPLIEKEPLRIPLILAQLHLQLFAVLQNDPAKKISTIHDPLGGIAEEFLTEQANRPTTAATGCPAIPSGMIASAVTLFGKMYKFLDSI